MNRRMHRRPSDAMPRRLCGHRGADEGGFTLAEAVIAIGIGTIVTLAAYSVLYSSQKTQSMNEQTAQTQQNARIAMELVATDLKDAGFNSQTLAAGVGNCGVNGVLPADNNVLGADTGPDSVSMIVPVSLSTLVTPITGAAPTPNVALVVGSVAAAGTDGFGVAPYALPNPVISIAGFHVDTVSVIAGDTLTLSSQVKLPKEAIMPTGMPVYWLKCIMYKVIHTNSNVVTEQPLCGGSLPCLVRGTPPCTVGQPGPACVPVVEGIEDLQVSYACDGCTETEDGEVDDQTAGTPNVFDDKDFLSNNAWNSGLFIPKTIRMAKVSVVARQMREEMKGEHVTGGTAIVTPGPLIVQDHNHKDGVFVAGDLATQAALTTYTRLRHRVLTRVVQFKNMGLF